jgi:hypothetical protein
MQSRALNLALGLALLMGSMAARAQSGRIPETHATSLAGTAVTLPEDLRGRVGVLVIGFSKSSGDVCKGWGQRLAESYRNSHEVAYYQMPVLESVPKLIRGMVVKSIKSGVPEAEQTHFIPMFSDESAWQKAAHYGNADDAYVLVVDPQGTVRWQTSGKVTDAGFAVLKQKVEAELQAVSSATK